MVDLLAQTIPRDLIVRRARGKDTLDTHGELLCKGAEQQRARRRARLHLLPPRVARLEVPAEHAHLAQQPEQADA